MPDVSASEFAKCVGVYQDEAQREAVRIMKHGRAHSVLISAVEYERLKARDRKALLADELSGEDIAAIAEAKAPDGAKAFDDEVA